eukprot:g14788.t1
MGVENYALFFYSDATEDQQNEVKNQVMKAGGQINYKYELCKGFQGLIPSSLINTLKAHPSVQSVARTPA